MRSSSAAGAGAQRIDHGCNLIDALALFVEAVGAVAVGRPVDPLFAVHRPEIAPAIGESLVLGDSRDEIVKADVLSGFADIIGVRPLVPDLHTLQHQRADIGFAGQEPQQFARGGFPVDPLGGEQRHRAAGQIES
jgi:hypothetical protein